MKMTKTQWAVLFAVMAGMIAAFLLVAMSGDDAPTAPVAVEDMDVTLTLDDTPTAPVAVEEVAE